MRKGGVLPAVALVLFALALALLVLVPQESPTGLQSLEQNQPPVFIGRSFVVDGPFSLDLRDFFSDPEGDALGFGLDDPQASLESFTLTFTPPLGFSGEYVVNVQVSDGANTVYKPVTFVVESRLRGGLQSAGGASPDSVVVEPFPLELQPVSGEQKTTIDQPQTTNDEPQATNDQPPTTSNEPQTENSISGITISAAPTIDDAILNSSGGTNTTAENLTLYVINAADGDADAVKNITSWYRNNVGFLSTYVPFDGGSNGTFAREYVEERNASVVGPDFLQTGGFDGFGAYDFTGNSSYINFSTVAYRTAPFTMAGWIKPSNATGAGTIIDTNGAFTVFRVYVDDTGNLQYDHFDNDDNLCTSIQSTTVLPTTSWTHFAVSLGTDNNQRIFINGQLESTGSGLVSPSVSYNDGDLKLGISQTQQDCMVTAQPPLNATLDEFRIYRVPLSLAQINALYNNLTNITVSNELTVGDVWRSEVVPNDGGQDGARVVGNNITILESGCSSLVFSANQTISSNQTCDNIVVNSGVVLIVNSTAAGNVSIGFFATNFTLHSGAVLNATATGHGPSSGPGAGGNSTAAGGGGHGGRGGRGSVAGGNASGSGLEPLALGSGGGNNGALLGGRGGGAIAIVGSMVALNGSVVADGGVAVGTTGGGSGGSINIRADDLSGTGIIRAAGSTGVTGSGGGGGGRIFVRFNTSSFDISQASVINGSGSAGASLAGEIGTLGFLDVDDDVLTVRQGWRWQANDSAIWNFTTMRIVNSTTRSNDTALNFSLGSLLFSNSSLNGEFTLYNFSVSATSFELNVSNITNVSFAPFNVPSITVGAGSIFNATGGGFAGGFGPGAGGNATTGGGGGHGGRGGRGTAGAGGNASGSGLEPLAFGSGGGNNGALLGGRGGGAIVIVADTLDVNGSIVADGGVAAGTAGGGSGGSINIRVDNLSGTGIIRAAGSTGVTGSGGGGGGRIFVRFNETSFDITQVSVINGSSSSGGSTQGETGTLGFLDVDDDVLTIRQGWRWQATDLAVWNFTSMSIINASTRSNDTILNFSLPSLSFSNSSISAETVVFNLSLNVTDFEMDVSNLSNMSYVTINVSSLAVSAGSLLNATAGGFTGGFGPGAGGNATTGGGGGHGGRGGRGTSGAGGNASGSGLEPSAFGSGGGNNGAILGGRGGGAFVIVASVADINGSVIADGGLAASTTGGGAGGTINIRADNLTGTGIIRAAGSTGVTGSGGGGGGRIFVRFNESSFDITQASVLNGSSSSGGSTPGETGTLGFLDVDDDVLTIRQGWRWQASDLAVWNFTSMSILNASTRSNVTILNFSLPVLLFSNSSIIGEGMPYNLSVSVTTVDFNRTNLSNLSFASINGSDILIDANSSFNASMGGFTAHSGPGAGGNATTGGGAGHGGRGGRGTAGVAGVPYGSSVDPITFGSGGGSNGASLGGRGGGAVVIVGSAVVLDGNISSNAGPAVSTTGGAAGGSINIRADNLSGSGSLYAIGSPGLTAGGGGGSGRIFIRFNESTYDMARASVLNSSGSSGGSAPGERGTIGFLDVDDNVLTIKDGWRWQGDDGVLSFVNVTVLANTTVRGNSSTVTVSGTYFMTDSNFTVEDNVSVVRASSLVIENGVMNASAARARLAFEFNVSFSDQNVTYLNGSRVSLANISVSELNWSSFAVNASNLSDYVRLDDNLVFVNSSAQPALNRSANITLHDLTVPDPFPTFDGDDDGIFEACPSTRCTEISYNGTTFVFNVSAFTSFSSSGGVTLTKDDSPDPVDAGDTLSYTLFINNTDGPITNVTLVESYPAQVTFNDSSPAPNVSNNTFQLADIPANGTFTITITVNVTSAVANGTVINNTVNLTFNNASGAGFFVNVTEGTTVISADNNHPSIAQVILNSTDGSGAIGNNATTDENLTVFIINATDADNDSVQNITDLRLNGTSIAVLNLPFETNSSSAATDVIRDYSTFGNNGTLGNGTVSAVPVWNSSGRVGGAYTFDGTDDFIDCGVSGIPSSPPITLEAWALFNQDQGASEYDYVIQASAFDGTDLFNIAREAATNRVYYVGDGAVQTGPVLSTGSWHHLVMVFRSSAPFVRFYLNGTSQTIAQPASTVDPTGALCEVGRFSSGTHLMNGTVDEVKIYDRELSADQVYQNYLDGNRSLHVEILHFNETGTGDIWSVAVTPNDNQNASDGTTVLSNNVTILEDSLFSGTPSLNSSQGGNTSPENVTTDLNVTTGVKTITNWFLTDTAVTNKSLLLVNMPMDGGTLAGSSVKDYSPSAYHASVVGATYSSGGGYDGKGAYTFDGSDKLTFPANITFGQQDNWTITFWAQRSADDVRGGIIGKQDRGSVTDVIWLLGDVIEFRNNTVGTDVAELIYGFDANATRQHYAFVANNHRLEMYVNGTFFQAIDAGTGFTLDGMGEFNSAAFDFAGTADELTVWNVSLTPSQIRALYLGNTTRFHSAMTRVGDTFFSQVTPNNNIIDDTTQYSYNLTIGTGDIFGRNQTYINSSSQSNTSVENLTINVTFATNVTQVYSYYRNGSPILAALYTFNTEEEVVRDYSGNNRTGQRRRLVVWQPTSGFDGRGVMNFAGSDDSLTIPSMTWNPRQPWSVSFWAQKDVDTAQGNVMGTRDDATDTIWLTASTLEFRNTTDGLGGTFFAWDANTSRNFYTLVASGSERLELYINGTFFDTLDVGTGYSINDIGDSASSFSFDGTLDDVAIWNTTLTPSQIRALFNNRSDVIVNSMTGVSDVWQLRATPGDNFSDGNTTALSMTVLEGDTYGFTTALLSGSPSSNTDSNLTASFTYSSTVDTNTVWWVNGSLIQLLNVPFDAEAYPSRDYAANSSYDRFGDVVWEPFAGINSTGRLRFDGSNDYVSVPQVTLRADQPWTLSVWAQKDVDNSNGGFVGTTNGVTDFISIRASDVEFRNSTNGGGGPTFTFDANTSLHFYAFRAGGNGSLELFVNGSRIGAVTSGTNFTINNIGAAVTGTGEDFDGALDEFILWNRSLSQEQIQVLYGAQNALIVSQETENGDAWQACEVPTDGIDDGQVRCTNAVTISDANNTHPVIAQVILNSTDGSGELANNAGDSENLTVFIVNATDADNDSVQNITDWRVNGSSLAVLNLPFETNVSSGTTGAVRDYSIFVNNGTSGNGTGTQPVWNSSGKAGGAFTFDGADDIIEVNDSWSLDLYSTISLAAWVYPTADGAGAPDVVSMIINKEIPGGSNSFEISRKNSVACVTGSASAGTFLFFLSNLTGPPDDCSGWTTGGASLPLNTWSHVALTYNGTNVSAYVNGVETRTLAANGTLRQIEGPVKVSGRGDPAPRAMWAGSIDEVLIFNRSITATQVAQLYADGLAGVHSRVWNASETETGDVWSVAVTPNDQRNASDGTTVLSNNVTILEDAQCPLNITTGTTLTQNVSCPATAVNILADNVALDCAGNVITYGTAGTSSAFGVLATSRTNVTIKNCLIEHGSASGNSTISILFQGSTRGNISNNTIRSTGEAESDGIELNTGSHHNNLRNNSIFVNGSGTDSIGFRNDDSDNNTFANNSIFTTDFGAGVGNSPIRVTTDSDNVRIENNTVLSTTGNAIGMFIAGDSLNVSVRNNTVNLSTNESGWGINVGADAHNASVTENVVTVFSVLGGSLGLIVDTGSDDGLVRNNTVLVTNGVGIPIDISDGTNVTDNSIIAFSTSGSSTGIFVGSANRGVIARNTVLANGTAFSAESSTNIDVLNNTFTSIGNESDHYGISLLSTSQSRLDRNAVDARANGTLSIGVKLDDASANNLSRTAIAASLFGVSLGTASVNNTFNGTYIITNGTWLSVGADSGNNTYHNTSFVNENGSIRVPFNFSDVASALVDQAGLFIRNNRSFVNTTAFAFLNTSAQIALDGLSFVDPRPSVDFEDDGSFASCDPPDCVEIGYNGSTYVFNVSHFTSFAAQENLTSVINISAEKADNPDPVARGSQLSYTITLNNTGNATAQNVTVVELYPSGVVFVSGQPTPSGNDTFSVGNLSPGQSFVINITVNVSGSLGNGSVLNNSVNVTFANSSGQNSSFLESELTTVLGIASLSVTKTDSPDPVTNGSVLSYALTVTNNGDEVAYNITAVDGYPANVSFIAGQPAPTGNNSFAVPNLTPGLSFVVNITVTVSANMSSGILNNSVNVTFANLTGESSTVSAFQLTTVTTPAVAAAPSAGGGGSNLFRRTEVNLSGSEVGQSVQLPTFPAPNEQKPVVTGQQPQANNRSPPTTNDQRQTTNDGRPTAIPPTVEGQARSWQWPKVGWPELPDLNWSRLGLSKVAVPAWGKDAVVLGVSAALVVLLLVVFGRSIAHRSGAPRFKVAVPKSNLKLGDIQEELSRLDADLHKLRYRVHHRPRKGGRGNV